MKSNLAVLPPSLRYRLETAPGGQSMGSVYNVPVWLSSQLSTTATQGTTSSAYAYDASQIVAVMRAEAPITADLREVLQ